MKQEQIDAIGQMIKEQYEFQTTLKQRSPDKHPISESVELKRAGRLVSERTRANQFIINLEASEPNFTRYALSEKPGAKTLEDAIVTFYNDYKFLMKNHIWKFISDESDMYENRKQKILKFGWKLYSEIDNIDSAAGIFYKQK
jgi:hypothetical protein